MQFKAFLFALAFVIVIALVGTGNMENKANPRWSPVCPNPYHTWPWCDGPTPTPTPQDAMHMDAVVVLPSFGGFVG